MYRDNFVTVSVEKLRVFCRLYVSRVTLVFSGLAAHSVTGDGDRLEVGVEEQLPRLDVDGGLPASGAAQGPGRVQTSPEVGTCVGFFDTGKGLSLTSRGKLFKHGFIRYRLDGQRANQNPRLFAHGRAW